MAPTRPCSSPHMPWTPRAPPSPPATRRSHACAPSPSTARWPSAVNGELAASAAGRGGLRACRLSAPTSSAYWRFQSWSDGGAAGPLLHDARCGPDACRPVHDRHRGQVHGPGRQLVVPGHSHVTRVRRCRRPCPQLHRADGSSGVPPQAPTPLVEAILAKYLAGGGPAAFGFPTHDEVGHFQRAGLLFHQGPHLLVVRHGRTRRARTHTRQVPRGRGARAGTGSRQETSRGSPAGTTHTSPADEASSGPPQEARTSSTARSGRGTPPWDGSARACDSPSTDQYSVKGGVRNLFAGGRITYVYKSRSTVVRC